MPPLWDIKLKNLEKGHVESVLKDSKLIAAFSFEEQL
jgi:hypothetical protein